MATATALRSAQVSEAFPTSELWSGLFATDEGDLFPIDSVPACSGNSNHSRGRQRIRRRREIGREANHFLHMLNLLHNGKTGSMTGSKLTAARPAARSQQTMLALSQVHSFALREASRLVRARRCLGMNGA